MKKFSFLFVFAVALTLSSCKFIAPTAINTVNSVALSELNLERNDYVVLKPISSESVINYKERSHKITISDKDGEFRAIYKSSFSGWHLSKFDGVAKYGYLSNDYKNLHTSIYKLNDPESFARNMAIYRLINACKVAGGDGLIEPIISMNARQTGYREMQITVTASAKVIKLKTDK